MESLLFEMDKDVLEKFNIALEINNELKNDVIVRLIKNYISNTFLNISKLYSVNPKESIIGEKTKFTEKARRKIPSWSVHQDQVTFRIIRAYFQILDEKGEVTVDELESRCQDPILYPDVYVSAFKSNYTQMKLDSEKSYGKVFVEVENKIKIWDQIQMTLLAYKHKFLDAVD